MTMTFLIVFAVMALVVAMMAVGVMAVSYTHLRAHET